MRLSVGDRVTVTTQPEDPVELIQHRHAVIVAVEPAADGPQYMVGHPPARRRFGPYPEGRLTPGWVVAR
jgi:hypothetical protein